VRLQGSDDLVVEVDPARLEQALTNVISNALRHGGGDVVLLAQKAGGGVEIHVLDEGPGFEPELLPRAFERFARADRARSEPGAGLGLSIVEVIAELHGGRANLRNRAGGGADVWLELPGPVRRYREARPTEAPRGETTRT
jgi:two-component system OmpR family sensor kinase